MAKEIVTSGRMALLLGGSELPESVKVLTALRAEVALEEAPVIAADGGAALALVCGLTPDAVVGDFDSLRAEDRARLDPATLHPSDDQVTTDFDKALAAIRAPIVLGVGFLGGRLDHQLAVMTGLTVRPERVCVLVGEEDVVCLCPPELALDLPTGTRLSLYPLVATGGTSEGLEWCIDGLDLRPDGRVGTSNTTTGPVRLTMAAPFMLLILPRPALRPLLAALSRSDARWPSRAE